MIYNDSLFRLLDVKCKLFTAAFMRSMATNLFSLSRGTTYLATLNDH